MSSAIAYQCPVCNGHGTISKPPWVAGDKLTWSDIGTGLYKCKACDGTGVLWHENV